MLDRLDSHSFAPHVRQQFTIGGSGVAIEATLVEVTDFKSQRAANEGGATAPAFSIVFEGPDTPVLAQGIYAVRHEELGRMDIFLVPIGPNGNAMQYEAVFT